MESISAAAFSVVDFLESIIERTISYGLEKGNIYVLVIVLTIVTLPAYYAFNAITKVAWTRAQQAVIEGKNILYVIAHPDDEAM